MGHLKSSCAQCFNIDHDIISEFASNVHTEHMLFDIVVVFSSFSVQILFISFLFSQFSVFFLLIIVVVVIPLGFSRDYTFTEIISYSINENYMDTDKRRRRRQHTKWNSWVRLLKNTYAQSSSSETMNDIHFKLKLSLCVYISGMGIWFLLVDMCN